MYAKTIARELIALNYQTLVSAYPLFPSKLICITSFVYIRSECHTKILIQIKTLILIQMYL